MAVTVSSKSRYKDTVAYIDGGVVTLGPFQPPAELLTPDANWSVHTVTQEEVGFPDLIAVRYFGPGSESLWWAVCLPNGIVDPTLDMYPGLRMRVPPRDLVGRFVSRSSNG